MENESAKSPEISKLDKALKISIIVGSLLVALSVAYYLIIFLPNKEQVRIKQQRQDKIADEQRANEQKEKEVARNLEIKTAKCLEDAKRFHQEYIKSISGYYMEPKYNYNKNLDKCLYSGGYRESQSILANDKSYWERIVKDVYTNETVLSMFSGFTQDNIKTFWDKHNELMNN